MKRQKADDIFEPVRVYIPREMGAWLRSMSKKHGIPMSRLMAIALDNERDQGDDDAFTYNTDLPTDEYNEYANAFEAGKIMAWLSKVPGGIAIDSLVLARRDMGIESRTALLRGLRELFEQELVETFKPARTSFNYGKDYERIRVKGLKDSEIKTPKRDVGRAAKRGKKW